MTGEQSTFESLADLIGKAGALNLCEQYGGQTLYIRSKFSTSEALNNHWSEFFGKDAWARLNERLGGKRVYIPAAPEELIAERNTAIVARMDRGEPAAEIGLDFKLTERCIRSIYGKVVNKEGAKC